MSNNIYDALRMNDELAEIQNTLAEMILKSHLSTKAALTVDECAIYTGMAKSYIYKLTHEGIIPHAKPNGKKIYFDRVELEQWMLSNKVCRNLDSKAVADYTRRILSGEK